MAKAIFSGSKLRRKERVYLFFILPSLLLLTLCGIVFLFRADLVNDPHSSENSGGIPSVKAGLPPLDPMILLRRLEEGDALERKQCFEEAAAAFSAITKSNPENDRAWGGLGKALLAWKNYRQAAEALDHACCLNVIEPRYFGDRGIARRAMKDLKGAFRDFYDAWRLKPGDLHNSNNLLFVALEMSDYELFDRTMAKVRTVNSDSRVGWIAAAAAKEMRLGNTELGNQLLKTASELLSPQDYNTLLSDRIFADNGRDYVATYK